MDRRAPQARPRRGGARDPLPPEPRLGRGGPSLPRGARGAGPRRAARGAGRLRRGESPARGRVRTPARGDHRRQAARDREGGAGLGGPLRETVGHLSVRLYRADRKQLGAPGGRVPSRLAIGAVSVYIRASNQRGSQPMSRTLMAALPENRETKKLSAERR